MKRAFVTYTIYGVDDREYVEKMLEEGAIYAVPLGKAELNLAELNTYEMTGSCPEGYFLDSDDTFPFIAVRDSDVIKETHDFALNEMRKASARPSRIARRSGAHAVVSAVLRRIGFCDVANIFDGMREEGL